MTQVGQKFSRLTVTKILPKGKIEALCKCGNTCTASVSHLKRGDKKSCGCGKVKDIDTILSTKYGKLTPVFYEKGSGIICDCDCGNTVSSTAQALKTGQKKSCGCSQHERKYKVGYKFESLEIVREAGSGSDVKYQCKCVCGKVISLPSNKISQQKSCGCQNVAHVQKGLSGKHKSVYKTWHRLYKSDKMPKEFSEFKDFLNYLQTEYPKEFANHDSDKNSFIEIIDNKPTFNYKKHTATICDIEYKWCRKCRRYVQNSEKFWYKGKTADQMPCRRCHYATRIKREYNLDYSDYLAMRRKCKGKCEICKEKKKLVVDHCHKTGKVRGLLCDHCNSALGNMNDDVDHLKKMIEYLDRGLTDIDHTSSLYLSLDKIDEKCPITNNETTVLDHCHDTNKIRGNVDWHVNIALGKLKDDPKVINNAIKYLNQ